MSSRRVFGSLNGPLGSLNRRRRRQSRGLVRTPAVIDIESETTRNNTFRTVVWTGKRLQLTVMSIGVGEDIGLEVHRDTDQFLRIEEGEAVVQMGKARRQLTFRRRAKSGDAILVPSGTWHNVINVSRTPLKICSIYAPPHHQPSGMEKKKRRHYKKM